MTGLIVVPGKTSSLVAAGLFGALWGLSAPFSVIFIIEQAMVRGSISHETYLSTIPWTHAMTTPGLGLAELVLGSPLHVWGSHSSGTLFLRNVAILGVANAVAWGALCSAVVWALAKMRRKGPA